MILDFKTQACQSRDRKVTIVNQSKIGIHANHTKTVQFNPTDRKTNKCYCSSKKCSAQVNLMNTDLKMKLKKISFRI